MRRLDAPRSARPFSRSMLFLLLWFLPSLLLLAGPAGSVLAATIHVPGDQPTIQAGIDAASAGDTVLVDCGRYLEHDIVMKSGVTLRSRGGAAECAVIDAGALGRVMYGENLDSATRIEGFTLTNGRVTGEWHVAVGGGAFFTDSSPVVSDCAFEGNHADYDGGGMKCVRGSATFTRCRFSDNWGGSGGGCFMFNVNSTFDDCEFSANSNGSGVMLAYLPTVHFSRCLFRNNNGGGLFNYDPCTLSLDQCTFRENQDGGAFLSNATGELSHCVFDRNTGGFASACGLVGSGGSLVIDHATIVGNKGGPALNTSSNLVVSNTLVAFNRSAAFTCTGAGSFTLSCCDAHGNTGGDWTDCAAGQEGVNGNFSANPLFCGAADYRLNSASPCTAPQLPGECGDLVGAIGVGCGTTSVAGLPAMPVRWGELKARIVAGP